MTHPEGRISDKSVVDQRLEPLQNQDCLSLIQKYCGTEPIINYYAVSPPSEFCTQNQWRDIRRLIRIASNIVFLHSKDKY